MGGHTSSIHNEGSRLADGHKPSEAGAVFFVVLTMPLLFSRGRGHNYLDEIIL